jgi:hypothetical protein
MSLIEPKVGAKMLPKEAFANDPVLAPAFVEKTPSVPLSAGMTGKATVLWSGLKLILFNEIATWPSERLAVPTTGVAFAAVADSVNAVARASQLTDFLKIMIFSRWKYYVFDISCCWLNISM